MNIPHLTHLIRRLALPITLLLFLLNVSGCLTHSTGRPAWVVNPQEQYPESQYLVAVGEGDSRRSAENRAAAGISRIFESQVHAEETLLETTTERSGDLETFDQFSELQEHVQIDSDQDLLNIQFGESYTSPLGRVHVVATLPRAQTTEIYRDRIDANSADITQLISESDRASKPIDTYAFRRAAAHLAFKNDRLLSQLSIINPGAHDRVRLSYNSQTLYSETAAAAKQISFAIELSGAAGNALRKTLTGMGFSEKETNPTLIFSGETSIHPIDLRRSALVFVRYRYTLETRTQDHRQVLALSGSSREGHISFAEAHARAERSLQKELSSELSRELNRYFDRQASVK